MSKKASRREDVTIHKYLDGKLEQTIVATERAIIKRKDGTEQIRWGDGYRAITRKHGKAMFNEYAITVAPLDPREFMRKLRETGGTLYTSSS
jgi:hypothetical protein